MLNKLLVINIAIFLAVSLVGIISFLFGRPNLAEIVCNEALALPAAPGKLLWRFWTPITYMFTHISFWHILANMLWLYFMGRIFLMVFNNKQMFGVYILGGLSGALLYILSYNVFPVFNVAVQHSVCLGASAAVTAIVIAICVMRPNMEIRFFGILPLTLKWLGILYVLFDLFQITGDNPGGHIAHLGGAIFGAWFAWSYNKGKDLTKGFNNIIDKIVTMMPTKSKHKHKMRVVYNDMGRVKTEADIQRTSVENQKHLDDLLDKISQSGYNALTKEEKEFLFKMGRK